MKKTIKRLGVILVIVLLFGAGVWGQIALARQRPGDAPVMKESVIAALGGFRSLAAEFIWFRADRLQSEGRFGELVQLASLLTSLEPHDAEVWNYASWNMSYNIAARMPRAEDRWGWVYAGVCLLRDEGLKWNPREPRLYFELADRFEMKIGTNKFDEDALLYQHAWRQIVADVAASGDWSRLGMDRAKMDEVEAAYREADIDEKPENFSESERAYRTTGRLDWGNAQASALYWAHQGLAFAKGHDRLLLLQKIRIARRLYGNPNRTPGEADS